MECVCQYNSRSFRLGRLRARISVEIHLRVAITGFHYTKHRLPIRILQTELRFGARQSQLTSKYVMSTYQRLDGTGLWLREQLISSLLTTEDPRLAWLLRQTG